MNRKTTINDLPPEIVSLIVGHVEHIAAQARFGPHPGAPGAHEGEGAAEDPAAAFFNAMLGGLFNLGGAGGAGAAAGAGGGAGGAQPPNAAGQPRPAGLFGAAGGAAGAAGANEGGAGAANPFRFGGAAPPPPPPVSADDSESDDDMPPLEPVPSSAAPPSSSAPATPAPAASTSNPTSATASLTAVLNSSASTSSPSTPAPALAPTPAAAPASSGGLFSGLWNFGRTSTPPAPAPVPAPAPAPAVVPPPTANEPEAREADSDTEMPHDSTAPPTQSTSAAAPPPAAEDSDDEIPRLEAIDSSPPTATAPSLPPPFPGATYPSDIMPTEMQRANDLIARLTGAVAATNSAPPNEASAAGAAATNGDGVGSDDDMPPLESIASPAQSPGSNKKAKMSPESDDDLPPLETIPGRSTTSSATTPAASTSSSTAKPASAAKPKPASGFIPRFPRNGFSSKPATSSSSAPPPSTSTSAAPAAAAAAAATVDSNDDLPPLETIPSPGPVSSTAAKGKASAKPKEVKKPNETSKPKAKKARYDSDDSMLPLEPIASARSVPSPCSSAHSDDEDKPITSFCFTSSFAAAQSARVAAGIFDDDPPSPTLEAHAGRASDDDMPPLETIPSVVSAAQKKQPEVKKFSEKKGKAKKVESEDDLPALETIPLAASTSTLEKKEEAPAAKTDEKKEEAPAAKTDEKKGKEKKEESDDDMPALESNPSSKKAAPKQEEEKKGKEPETIKGKADSDDDMPTHKSVTRSVAPPSSAFTFSVPPTSSSVAAPSTSSPVTVTTPSIFPSAASRAADTAAISAEAASSLLDEARIAASIPVNHPPTVLPPMPVSFGALAATPAGGVRLDMRDTVDRFLDAFGGPVGANEWEDGEDEDMDDEDYDDEDDEDEDDDDDDEDHYDSDDSDAPQRIYPDGLPTDPLLPLLFINRSFLHESRKLLYKRVHIPSPYVATLLLRTLQRPESAGYLPGDEEGAHAFDDEENTEEKKKARRNALREAVKMLSFDAETEAASLGRGGVGVIIEILELVKGLEGLTIRPRFLKSVTKPFLAVLATLTKLKAVDLCSSPDLVRPFLLTSPRIIKLLRQSWLALEDLTLEDYKSGEEGPSWEEDEMYDLFSGEEAGEKGEQAAVELGGEKGKKKEEKKKKGRGLKRLALYGFDVGIHDIKMMLQDSRKTLETLLLSRPGLNFSRYAFASTMLNFGSKLTVLDLSFPPTWYPAVLPGNGVAKKPFPTKPKGHKNGQPKHETLMKISEYHYILDAIMPYLPVLKEFRFDGNHASTSLFSLMPPSLSKLAWGHCPSIKPDVLYRLLNKSITRTRIITNADGAKVSKQYQTTVARGLICVSVHADDASWTDAQVADLQDAFEERSCCLHLSSAPGGGFGLGGLGGIPLGGLGGIPLAGGLGGAAPVVAGGMRIPIVPIQVGVGAGGWGELGGGVGGAGAAGGGLFGGAGAGAGAAGGAVGAAAGAHGQGAAAGGAPAARGGGRRV